MAFTTLDPDQPSKRYLLVALSCIGGFGSYFVHNSPAPMELELCKDLSINSAQFNMLYSAYSAPNILLPMISGSLMDKYGYSFMTYATAFLIVLGQALFTLGLYQQSFILALVGRGVLGCGGDSLDIGFSGILTKWFKDNDLSLVFGINSSVSLIGSFSNDTSEPLLVRAYHSTVVPAFLGLFLCVISLLSTHFFLGLDRRREKILQSSNLGQSEGFKCSDIRYFGSLFWVLLVNLIFTESSMFCLMYITSGYFQQRFAYDAVEAGFIMSLGSLIPAIFCPVLGRIVDRLAHRVEFLALSGFMVIFAQLALAFTQDSERAVAPVVYFAIICFAYAIYCTVYWTCVSIVVASNGIGTAYGLNYSLFSIGDSVFPILVGSIIDNHKGTEGYFWVNILLAGFGVVSIITAAIAFIIDLRLGQRLRNRTADKSSTSGSQSLEILRE